MSAVAIYKCRNCQARFGRPVDNPTTQRPTQFLPIYMQGGGYPLHKCESGQTGVADLVGGDDRPTADAAPRQESGPDRIDAERWRAFRARDDFDDLESTHFQDQFRKDADAIIDAAIRDREAAIGAGDQKGGAT